MVVLTAAEQADAMAAMMAAQTAESKVDMRVDALAAWMAEWREGTQADDTEVCMVEVPMVVARMAASMVADPEALMVPGSATGSASALTWTGLQDRWCL